jgi:hypothetical protein
MSTCFKKIHQTFTPRSVDLHQNKALFSSCAVRSELPLGDTEPFLWLNERRSTFKEGDIQTGL